MPNWCDCELTITATKKHIPDLKRFKEFAYSEENIWGKEGACLDTNKFIPYPKEYLEADKRSERHRELKYRKTINEVGEINPNYPPLTEEEKKELLALEIAGVGEHDDGFNSGGYEWCINHWGTKWGICEPSLSDKTNNPNVKENELFYYFQCAWSPCLPVIEKMAEMFPTLRFNFKYWEAGNCFRGIFIIKGNKIIRYKEYKYRGGRGG